MGNKVLAFDFGGSSYRAIIGEVKDGKLKYEEIARYANVPLNKNNGLYWDYDKMLVNIKNALKIASKYNISSIAIDTWGVDYALISDGKLLDYPHHYRDARNIEGCKKLNAVISNDDLYNISGIQPMNINTVCQLQSESNEKLLLAEKLLFMPDLFAYYLTGEMHNEFTVASTSGLLNVAKKSWNYELIERLGLPQSIFGDIIMPGEKYGIIKSEIANECGLERIPVIAVCGHDTASAIFAVPTIKDEVYISSGTWSLMGVNCDTVNTKDNYFTNEGGYGGKVTYLRNIMGMWLIQETMRALKESGNPHTIGRLDKRMDECVPIKSVINPNADEFAAPCDMPAQIIKYCAATKQDIPDDIGQIVDIIYRSLAMSYRMTVEKLEEIFNKHFARIYIVGGGSQAEALCRLTADITGKDVFARPSEATAIGNITVQLIALGELTEQQAKDLIIESEQVKHYIPNANSYEEQYATFVNLIHGSAKK